MNYQSFKTKLDRLHQWPSLYMFKFIVPVRQQGEVFALFPKHELKTKASKNGNYVSVTAQAMMRSSDDVIKIYEEAHEIEGIVAL
jgi:hypothetical protein